MFEPQYHKLQKVGGRFIHGLLSVSREVFRVRKSETFTSQPQFDPKWGSAVGFIDSGKSYSMANTYEIPNVNHNSIVAGVSRMLLQLLNSAA